MEEAHIGQQINNTLLLKTSITLEACRGQFVDVNGVYSSVGILQAVVCAVVYIVIVIYMNIYILLLAVSDAAFRDTPQHLADNEKCTVCLYGKIVFLRIKKTGPHKFNHYSSRLTFVFLGSC